MRQIRIPIGPVTLFAVEDGEGPGFVFLHGGLASHESVAPLVRGLTENYRVITPDLRGSGRSWCTGNLSFDRLADDVLYLLDHLGIHKAFVGGISTGSGAAVRFVLRYPERAHGLLVVRPVYAGADIGYTAGQADAFAQMDAVAGRASTEGVEVLRSLYDQLPDEVREGAWRVASTYDAESVAATSRFIASGAQPFRSSAELQSIGVPTLLVRGDDQQHPAEVSDMYEVAIPGCRVLAASHSGLPSGMREFCDAVIVGHCGLP